MNNVFDIIPDRMPFPDVDTDKELSAQEFATKVLNSPQFYTYIKNGILAGDLPSAVVLRLMDYGWGKPPERVELTGKDGKPIETVTEIKRVIVHAPEEELNVERSEPRKHVTH